MKKVRFFSTVVLILFLGGILLSAASALAAPKAEVIFVHGRIYQPPRYDGMHLDCTKLGVQLATNGGLSCESHSYAEALVKDSKVVAVGDTNPF
jgi:hypothetical protein